MSLEEPTPPAIPGPGDGAPAAGSAAPRRRWRGVLLGLGISLGLGAGLLGAGVWFLSRYLPPGRPRHWHARLSYKQYDCSRGTICRYPASVDSSSSDAAGNRFRLVTNAEGFRGALPPEARSRTDELRVAFFGDSMIFGVGVDETDTLPAQVSSRLQATFPGRPVSALNFGLPMNYMVSSVDAYRELARRYRPDAVVFCNPTRLQPRDVNHRLHQIYDSRVLQLLFEYDAGRWLINVLQARDEQLYSPDEAAARIRSGLSVLVDDQGGERPPAVVFFNHWDSPGDDGWSSLPRVVPPGLRYVVARAGLSFDEYRTRHAIPGDGHPTAAANAWYAGRIVEALVPALRRP